MARGRGKVEVSLFPFLSVLCCMIGVFMLFLVIILSTRVIEAQDQTRQAAKKARQKAAQGSEKPDDGQSIDAETYRALDEQLTELAGQLATKQAEQDELTRRLQALQTLLETKRDELSLAQLAGEGRRALALDEPDPVRPVPDLRFRVTKKPVFVEIQLDGYLVQPEKTLYPPLTKKRVGKEDHFTASPELRQFLEQVDRDRQEKYLLFLVHPNGIDGYWAMRKYLNQEFQVKTEIPQGDRILIITKSRIDMGVEPFSVDWQFFAEQSQP